MRAEIFCVELKDGQVHLVGGHVPPALMSEFRDVAARLPTARGRVRAFEDRPRARLEVSSLDGPAEQRLRNVFARFSTGLVRRRDTGSEAEASPRAWKLAAAAIGGALGLVGLGVFVQGRPRTLGPPHGSPVVRDLERMAMDAIPDEVIEKSAPFLLRLRSRGVVAPASEQSDALLAALGPEFAAAAGPRAVMVALDGSVPLDAADGLTRIVPTLRRLGVSDAAVRCDDSAGCILTAAGRRSQLVAADELSALRRISDCVAARVAARLGDALVEVGRTLRTPLEVRMLEGPVALENGGSDGTSDGMVASYVFLDANELDDLARWAAVLRDSPAEPFGYAPPFGASLRPSCRVPAPPPVPTSPPTAPP